MDRMAPVPVHTVAKAVCRAAYVMPTSALHEIAPPGPAELIYPQRLCPTADARAMPRGGPPRWREDR